jgi:hypothetical protein
VFKRHSQVFVLLKEIVMQPNSPPPNRPLPSRPLPPTPVPLNDYTKLLRDRPLDLFRKYSVSPPDGAVGDAKLDALGSLRRNRVLPLASRSTIPTDGMFSRFFKEDMGPTGEGFTHGVVGKKIAWIRIVDDPSRHGAVTFEAIIPGGSDTIPAGHLPVWFLPWESRYLVEMTIPPRQGEEDNDPNDPKIFFTAGINGCSVFVRGDPRSPTITHAGISQGQTPYGNDPASFWRDLLTSNLAGQNIHAGKTWEVNNTDYINQTGVSGGAQTANTDEYLKWLKTLPSGPITVSHVVPWGCVFGIRYGRLWSFYLQENAVIHTYKIVAKYSTEQVTETKKVLGPITRQVTKDVGIRKLVKLESTVNRPVKVRDFFPGTGRPGVNFIDTWQKW